MNKVIICITAGILLACGLVSGMVFCTAVTGIDVSPDKAVTIGSSSYHVSTDAAEVLRGKSSFPVTIYGPPTPDSAGDEAAVKVTVSGGENLGILNGQMYISYSGDTSNVKEFTIPKIPACGYVTVMFVTNSHTTPAKYKITAHFPNGSSDYVKVKVVRYFGELDSSGIVTEPITVPAVKPRTAVPTPTAAVEPEPTVEVTVEPTEIATPAETAPVQSTVGFAGLAFALCGGFLLFRRE
ncbi:MAG TPA: hypothetical protein O0X70_04790 [Methanocorpusculum sp.]|nr:hypothetical protein [Methanocorpusculum sp.]